MLPSFYSSLLLFFSSFYYLFCLIHHCHCFFCTQSVLNFFSIFIFFL